MMTGISSRLVVAERSYTAAPISERHPFYQVVLPRQGRLEMEIAGERGFAGASRFALVQPGVEHRYWAMAPNRFLILDVPPELITEAQRGLERPGAIPDGPFSTIGERLAALSGLLQAELARGGLGEPMIAESLGLYACSVLLQPAAAPVPDRCPSPGARRLAVRTRDALEAAVLQPRSLREIADAVGASSPYMQRSFRAYYGVTIVAYLQARRLEHARSLLHATDLSITEIAFASGFGDLSYFSRLFRREIGLSPARYRESVRAGSDKDSR